MSYVFQSSHISATNILYRLKAFGHKHLGWCRTYCLTPQRKKIHKKLLGECEAYWKKYEGKRASRDIGLTRPRMEPHFHPYFQSRLHASPYYGSGKWPDGTKWFVPLIPRRAIVGRPESWARTAADLTRIHAADGLKKRREHKWEEEVNAHVGWEYRYGYHGFSKFSWTTEKLKEFLTQNGITFKNSWNKKRLYAAVRSF